MDLAWQHISNFSDTIQTEESSVLQRCHACFGAREIEDTYYKIGYRGARWAVQHYLYEIHNMLVN